MRRMPAEWEHQSAILLAMPHEKSDWYPYLREARENFAAVINEITKRQKCLLLVDDWELYREMFPQNDRLIPIQMPTNDTWARDFAPLGIEEEGKKYLLDFGFNGWGLKFPAFLDNQVSRNLDKKGIFRVPLRSKNFILEGGSIESNGAGIVLTNTQCLLEANRNPEYSQEEIEMTLKRELGAQKVLWCHHGYLAGDDTNSHIDTLARFIGENQIAYIKCDNEKDEHFSELAAMEQELKAMRNLRGEPFELFALPFSEAIYHNGERLPASYANFLFINGAVLLPVYGDKNDQKALEVMRRTLPSHEIIPIDCRVLIRQHGSLHCISMQFFDGVV